ncbi:dTMP kinase [Chloroherpeton thalassium ATCC 35110]|uniref:Thymidylate kinase n=1 Tax=Chloroherpeton thalassium (strain ATCC 35110 / GB-78) TaxID=517418 RepID=B3QXL1_CHLT3|nr:dTMP kinase [Chloroherpeton thalassium]ACF14926.1 dTMP kinase [Chloroherpeton thalassium ATCC 35110]
MQKTQDGFLITFEGIDGSGKSTQIKLLKDFLQSRGFEVLSLREPGGVPVAEQIRAILLENKNEINPIAELLLFSASRAALVQAVIIPALEQRQVVVLDRFYDSTVAYQGYGRGISLERIHQINEIASFGLLPNLTFYFDLQPEDALLRKFSEKSLPLSFKDNEIPLDRMERAGLEFFQRVRTGYKELVQTAPERFYEIDALCSISEIHQKVVERIKTHDFFHAKTA